MDPIESSPGDTVIEDDQEGHGMFCLLEGQAEVVARSSDGERVLSKCNRELSQSR
jgi:CRP-like cAMP-binding protein